MLRGCFQYQGAFMWEMQSGMGDTIFAPYYDVLVQRGVQFKFFHQVRELELSPDASRIQTIHIERQAEPRDGRYDPLIDINGLRCWPSGRAMINSLMASACARGWPPVTAVWKRMPVVAQRRAP
ncbi:MAG: hypothetical protein IPP90_10595 [Gemmatimonadaceae bacterium]|nr:hypothetical protein [Gemmatimonadaceae bacterium]